MTVRYIFTLLLFLCIPFTAINAATITGKVVDAETHQPLEGVIVHLSGSSLGAATDATGLFQLIEVKEGLYELVASYISFKTETVKISLKEDETKTINIELKPDNGEKTNLKEVTIKSKKQTHTENALLLEMHQANQIVSGISAMQIAKTQDRNAADVVKRIPGVTILEDRFIMVRGLYDRYNTTWLNDAGAPSAEMDKKSFSFDLIPSGQIDRILIYKTPSPELPGDFAGGMVKLYTSSIPEKNQTSIGFQTSIREYTTGSSFNYNPKGKTDWLGYDDGTRAIPSFVPTKVQGNEGNINVITQSFNNNWKIFQKTATPDLRFSFTKSNVGTWKGLTIGNVLGLNYSSTVTNNQIIRRDFEQADTNTQTFSYKDQESIQKNSVAIMENTGVSFGKSRIEWKNIYNRNGKASVIIRDYQPDPYTVDRFLAERNYIMSYQSIATFSSQLNGTHTSKDDNTKYTWTLGYNNLIKDQPDLRRIRYNKASDATPDSMYAASAIASQVDPVYGGGRFFAKLQEHVYSFNHNLNKKLELKHYKFELNAGNYIEYKDRTFDARLFGYTAKTTTPFSYKTLGINEIFAPENVGDANQFKISESTNKGDSYTAENKLIATYVALVLPVGDKIKISGGVRHEINLQSLHSYTLSGSPISIDLAAKILLPSVNIAYNFNEKSLVRFAYGKTINRPEFREQAPFYFYDNEDRAGLYGALYPSLFNPQGKPLRIAKIDNFDVRWELYPSNGELIQIGAFYKSFIDPIQKVLIIGGDNKDFTFVNTQSAKVYGVEAEIRKNLLFADEYFHTKAFQYFTLVGNVSLIKSEMIIGNEATNNIYPDLPVAKMQGQSPYTINLGTYFQQDAKGLRGSLLYNVFGPRTYSLGLGPVANLYELPFHSLDFNFEKTFNKHYLFNIGIQNLLNSRIAMAYDFDNNNKIDATESKFMWKDYRSGRYLSIGFKLKF